MGELVRINSGDGVELDGYLAAAPSQQTLIIHLHGLAGSFYENAFVHKMAEVFPTSGISFLTVNTRGHDYVADAFRSTTGEYLARGGGRTSAAEATMDLVAWMEYGLGRGYESLILEGHSAGAATVGSLFREGASGVDRVVGVSLLSPADMRGLQAAGVSAERLKELDAIANEMCNDNRSDEWMPDDALEDYYLSASFYQELRREDGPWDIFPFSRASTIDWMKDAPPTLVTFGTDGEACPIDPQDALKIISSSSGSATTTTIDGAGHSYRGFEDVLARTVSDWARSLN